MNYNRAFPRLSLNCEIEFTIQDSKDSRKSSDKESNLAPLESEQEGSQKSTTRDISAGGICLITERPLPIGTILNLIFYLGGRNSTPIHAKGEIVWTEKFEIGSQVGYDNGIKFTRISNEDRETITSYINKMFI
ncbi:MAG: PilZ domain-containing protein [Spirochaetales bacterium]|nr:PilZ domain-containing protein [Spirochaetales bacterium]